MYAEAWAHWRALNRMVTREGFTVARRAGPGVHPALKASLEVLGHLRLLGAELGLSPSARSRLRVPVRPSSSSAKLDAFLLKHGDDG